MASGGSEIFTAAAARWRKFDERSGPALANLVATATRIADSDSLPLSERRAALQKIQSNAEVLVRLDADASARQKACENVSRAQLRENQYNEVIPNFKQFFEEAVADALSAPVDLTSSAELKEINSLLSSLDGNGNADISVAVPTVRSALRCPILHGEIKLPMKNTACGHVYSYEGAVKLLLQANEYPSNRLQPTKLDEIPAGFKGRCPVAGCPSSFTASSLKRDFATELTQRTAASSSAPRQSLETEHLDVCDLGD